MNIGERIKAKRVDLGLTLSDIGDRLGVNKSTVNRYETGETRRIPFATIEKLAAVLNTTPEYLLGFESGSGARQPALDAEVLMIARDMQSLPRDKINMLKKIVRAMSDTADEEMNGHGTT